MNSREAFARRKWLYEAEAYQRGVKNSKKINKIPLPASLSER